HQQGSGRSDFRDRRLRPGRRPVRSRSRASLGRREEHIMTKGEGVVAAPFRSYALERSDTPRFHIRRVKQAQGLYPAHKHDYFQILYYMTDAPALRIGLTSHKPRPGSIYFIAPMVPHQVRFDQSTRCVVIYFDLDLLRPNITRSYPIAELVRL